MKVKRLVEHAILPSKAHAGDLGYDLYSSDQITLHSGETKLISTGISVQFPEGYGGLIRDRSSIATKRQLFTVAGVIDNGYTGEIKVALYNSTESFQTIYRGDKIAQMILIPTVNFTVEEVDETISNDGRGNNGFGSTGN
jgi:dUTP pyrophosphatase